MSSARFITRPARRPYEQGNGLMDVAAAWDLLRTNIKTVRSARRRSRSTRCSAASWRRRASAGHLRPRGRHRRPAVHADVHLHAQPGGGGSTTYNVSWVGNDGTFSSPALDLAPRRALGDVVHRQRQPDDRGRPLGDPQPGRPVDDRDRLPDDEHGHRPVHAHRREQLHGRDSGHDRPDQRRASFFVRFPPGLPRSRSTSAARAPPGTGQAGSCAGTRTASGSTATRARLLHP